MSYNSTIISKKKRCRTCNSLTYIFSKNECRQCATISSTQRRIEKFEAEEGLEDESLANLVSDLDLVFSRYIRLKNADINGISECYTCGKREHYTLQQCGHYISRASMATRFLEQNTRCQCKNCNEFKSGNIEEYTKRLEAEQSGITEWLGEQSRQVFKWSREELKGMISDYRFKLKLTESKIKK
jgi:hypothetical protein